MNQTQKIIKYLALALAFFIIFTIISITMHGLFAVTNIFEKGDSVMEKLEELKIEENASVLDIEVKTANVIIKQGENLKAETNNKYINVKESNNKLFIKETRNNFFGKRVNSDLIIYIPSDFIFDGVAIDSGAGTIDIDNLSTKNLDLDLGAGKVTINNLNVLESTSIDGGAGKISILNGSLHNLELDMGVGELDLSAKLSGNSDIDAGVGKLSLNLIGNDYKIKVDKGIGSASINGNDIKDDTYYGEGSNIVDIDGGVGSIDISYENR